MVRPKFSDCRLLPIELPRESIDLVATGQGELRDMLLKQPLIRIRPARCGPAVLPALRPVGVCQPFGSCGDLTFDDAQMALRLGLLGFHAREQETSVRGLDHYTVPVDDKGTAAFGM